MKRFGKLANIKQKNGIYYLDYFPVEDQVSGPTIELHPLSVLILQELDAQKSLSQITERLSPMFDTPAEKMKEIAEDVEFVFVKHFTDQPPFTDNFQFAQQQLIELIKCCRQSQNFESRNTIFRNNRSPFPLTLQWLVTNLCNRKCVYCYQGAQLASKATDSSVTLDELKRIVREAAQLGANGFFLTGGEPLLREDIYELIVYALEKGITPEFISKQFIPEVAVKKMADAGLRDVYLSIDSLQPAPAKYMTGIGGFAKKISQTVAHLAKHQINVHAKSVFSSANVDAFQFTLEELERLGAASITIDKYSDNLERHQIELRPSARDIERLFEIVQAFEAHGERKLQVNIDSLKPAKPYNYDVDGFTCHNGRTALLFNPNGDISRCDKKLPGGDMIVGNIKQQSVAEAWNSEALLESLDPPREKYRGTDCYHCDTFDTCLERGRCYYDAYLTSGTLYGPEKGMCKYFSEGATRAC